MALTHAKASLVAMVTLDVMSGSLSVFRVGELAATCFGELTATCWTALLVRILLSPTLCRGALCVATFGLCASTVSLAQLGPSKVLSGWTGAAVVLGGDTVQMGNGSSDAMLGAALFGDNRVSLSADVDGMLGAAFTPASGSTDGSEEVSPLTS